MKIIINYYEYRCVGEWTKSSATLTKTSDKKLMKRQEADFIYLLNIIII